MSITAPTSGKVLVCLGAGIRNNASPATNERAVVTYRVLEDGGNGDVFTSESAYRGIISPGPVVASTYAYRGTFSLERGLTPGRQYYIQMRHRSTSGAGAVDIASRDITVIPVP